MSRSTTHIGMPYTTLADANEEFACVDYNLTSMDISVYSYGISYCS